MYLYYMAISMSLEFLRDHFLLVMSKFLFTE